MRSIGHVQVGCGVAVLAALLAGPALGNSKITYSVALGGNNHQVDWKAGTRTLYSDYSIADGQ